MNYLPKYTTCFGFGKYKVRNSYIPRDESEMKFKELHIKHFRNFKEVKMVLMQKKFTHLLSLTSASLFFTCFCEAAYKTIIFMLK